jgi:L-amino acid N-acyltransferase
MTDLVQGSELHAEGIQAIFNQEILHSTSIYEEQPRSLERVQQWVREKHAGGWPLWVALSAEGQVLGFSTYAYYRMLPGYRYTVEHSVYVAEGQRGKGLGRALLQRVTEDALAQGRRSMIGVIDAENAVSIALHEREGFQCRGRLPAVGFKFQRWLDVLLYQKDLSSMDAR